MLCDDVCARLGFLYLFVEAIVIEASDVDGGHGGVDEYWSA